MLKKQLALWVVYLWLEVFLGFEPRMVTLKVRVRPSRYEIYPPYVGIVRAVPRLCVLCPDICLTTEEKITEQTSVRVVDKRQLGMTQWVDMAAFEFSRREGFE